MPSRKFLSLVLAGVSFAPASSLFAQSGPLDYRDPEVIKQFTFEEIRASFWNYFEGDIGDVFDRKLKKFLRWEALARDHVDENGFYRPPGTYFREDDLYHSQRKNLGPRIDANGAPGTWTFLGPDSYDSEYNNNSGRGPGIGRLSGFDIAVQDPNVMYVSSPTGGVWKSVDAGASWTNVSDTLTVPAVSNLAISHQDLDTVYVSLGDVDSEKVVASGMLKTENGGESWSELGFPSDEPITKFVLDPNDAETLLACVEEEDGIFKSTDGGTSWTNVFVSGFYLDNRLDDIAYRPGDSTVVYACSPGGIFRSANGGDTFTQVTISDWPAPIDIRRTEMAVSPADPDVVYVFLATHGGGMHGIWKSEDAGLTFSLIFTGPPYITSRSGDGSNNDDGQVAIHFSIACSSTDADVLYGGSINIWRSTDGALSWDRVSSGTYGHPDGNYTHVDIVDLYGIGGVMYACTDGGLFKTQGDGTTWTDLNNGIGALQPYALYSAETHPLKIGTGSQDNATLLRLDASDPWWGVGFGDGQDGVYDRTDDNLIFFSSQSGFFYRTLDGGGSYETNITSNIGARKTEEYATWTAPIYQSDVSANVFYAAYANIWRTEDRGETWTKMTDFFPGQAPYPPGLLELMVFAPSNNDVIYVYQRDWSSGSTVMTLMKSLDGGGTWSVVDEPTTRPSSPNALINTLCIHPSDPNTLFIAYNRGSSGESVLFTSIDGGENWIDITGSLDPQITNYDLVAQGGLNNRVYLGRDQGVYHRDDVTGDWTLYTLALPNVPVRELEIYNPTGSLRAATFGRGIWESCLVSDEDSDGDGHGDTCDNCPVDGAKAENYGTGWPGTQGVPSLTSEKPFVGSSFVVQVGNSLGSDTGGFLVSGLASASLPTGLGGTLLVLPTAFHPIDIPAGGLSIDADVPNDPAFCGVEIFLQAIENDPNASHGFSFSPGLELDLG